VQASDNWQNRLDLVAIGLALPAERVALDTILEHEASRTEAQLGALSEPFRARLWSNLGIETVLCDSVTPSRSRGQDAATRALEAAGIAGKDIGLIIDFTTFAEDTSPLASLANELQHALNATNAFVFGTRGAGCCGFHVALRIAQSFFASDPGLDYALLVASDRACASGRVCLPISVMADAASAVVIARPGRASRRIGLIRAVMTQTVGRFSGVIGTELGIPRVTVDPAFETQILPLHFVVLSRLLAKALRVAELSRADISALVYPNTTELDRRSVARALEFEERQLLGPGPRDLGHAFANDLLINAKEWFHADPQASGVHSAWLAAGSGFTWGAAIIDAIR